VILIKKKAGWILLFFPKRLADIKIFTQEFLFRMDIEKLRYFIKANR